MKAIYDNIQIEGTLEEIAYIFDKIRFNSSDNVLSKKESSNTTKIISSDKELPKAISAILPSNVRYDNSKFNSLKETFSNDDTTSENTTNSLLVSNFISALYRYKPDCNSVLGRGPYVVSLLSSGEIYSIKKLVQLSNSNTALVSNSIRRAVDAGCIIEVTGNPKVLTKNTKVKLLKLGTVEQAKKLSDSLKSSKEYKDKLKAIRNNKKHFESKELSVGAVNSPPITKIIYK
jgi:hypothetical protein